MKKYKLKPGNHQFAPGEHGWHNNDNLSDAEAAWYLQKYPHIRSLFSDRPEVRETESPKEKKTKRKRIGVIATKISDIQQHENISATN